jgi:choice-of-anchor A domain-containing protein
MQPIKLQTTVPIVLGLLLSFSAKANATDFNLGVAANYNLFATSGNVDQTSIDQFNSDTEGPVAAAENITLSGFSIGASLPTNYSGVALVAGGNLNLSNGYVNGIAVYGGGTNGNTVTLVGSSSAGSSNDVTGGPLSPIQDATLINSIDFSAADTSLQKLSDSYANDSENGNVQVTGGGGTITLTGPSNSNTEVFNLTASQLADATDLVINADPNAEVIINVSNNIPGQTAATLGGSSGLGIQLTGTSEQNVLYNFSTATTLSSNEVDIQGDVLAPDAAFTFNNGQVNGNVVVASFDGDAQINDPALSTPEPGSLVGLGSLALLSSFCLRRKAKKV